MKPPAVQVSGLVVQSGRATLLGPVDCRVEEGEHLLVVGRSGCGKTSLLRALAGFAPVAQGRIELFGKLVQDGARNLVEPRERDVGLVFQGGALWPHLSVLRTLLFTLKSGGVERGEAKRRAGELLELVELAGYDKRKVPTLSGGEAQRLAIARALALSPSLLLLDEPLGPLDAELRRDLLSKLDGLRRELNLTLIHVTHDPEESAHVASRRMRLADGRVVPEDGIQ